MGLLNWLLGEAVEAPGIALDRSAGLPSFDPAAHDFSCANYGDYLRKRRELIEERAKSLEAAYKDAEERARVICEKYAADLDKRKAELDAAEAAFMALRVTGRHEILVAGTLHPEYAEVLRTLRREAATQAIPIVMISGNVQATEQFYVQRYGADDFMKKPFGRGEVFERIRQLVLSGRLPARAPVEQPVPPAGMSQAEWDAIPDIAMPDEAHAPREAPPAPDDPPPPASA